MEQSTSTVLMIRPAHFGFNPDAAESNTFQRPHPTLPAGEIAAAARDEFDGLVAVLRGHGVRVVVVDDTDEPATPDACFPNNWISMHADGTVVLYPMQPPSRRAEVREDVVDLLRREFTVERVIDLRAHVRPGEFLEGTGSLVLDHVHRRAYAGLSARTTPRALATFGELLGYEIVAFETDAYHTNVLMTIGTGFAIVGAPVDVEGREIVRLTPDQVARFAGNMLEVRNAAGDALLVASDRARNALDADQVRTLERHCTFVTSPLPTIEAVGGGSARCMLAEIFLSPTG